MSTELHRDISDPHARRVSGIVRHKRYVPRRTDQRRRSARRAKTLREHWVQTLVQAGRAMTVDLTERVMRASELTALAEDMRAKMLRGEADVCADDLVRVTRLADMAVRRLTLPTGLAKPLPLRERLASDVP
jgi:hypothetical protein